ncbi:MAG TPA: hypothetical protein VGT79_10125 [Xanthomonadaceae bacterium]|nr:hypothetical protein [Xanthomonadaceae bacterium]
MNPARFRIERRLKGDAKKWNFRRPCGMRCKTFERLKAAYWREEEIRDGALAVFMDRHGWLLK